MVEELASLTRSDINELSEKVHHLGLEIQFDHRSGDTYLYHPGERPASGRVIESVGEVDQVAREMINARYPKDDKGQNVIEEYAGVGYAKGKMFQLVLRDYDEFWIVFKHGTHVLEETSAGRLASTSITSALTKFIRHVARMKVSSARGEDYIRR